MKLPSLFDRQDRLDSISRAGDPLVRLSHAISWEEFRPILSKLREKERKSPAGRKPFDVLLMFKTLVLQRLYNLSDHQVEFQIKDRLSFQRFLGLGLEDVIPDEKTIWAFREHMSEAGLEKTLFAQFERFLQRRGLKTKEGSEPHRVFRRHFILSERGKHVYDEALCPRGQGAGYPDGVRTPGGIRLPMVCHQLHS